VNESGTGYRPSAKLRIAACWNSTGWMEAAVLIPAELVMTDSPFWSVWPAMFSTISASLARPATGVTLAKEELMVGWMTGSTAVTAVLPAEVSTAFQALW
jgi:hypothetical protein